MITNDTRTGDHGCPNEEDSVWRIRWPATAPDSTQSVACSKEGHTPGLGVAHRRCLTGGVWDSVDASECESVAVRAIRMRVGKMRMLWVKMCVVLLQCSTKLLTVVHDYLQTEEFVNSLEAANSTLNVGEIQVFQNISQDLNKALQPAEEETPIPPQDLQTVAVFVEVVAE